MAGSRVRAPDGGPARLAGLGVASGRVVVGGRGLPATVRTVPVRHPVVHAGRARARRGATRPHPLTGRHERSGGLRAIHPELLPAAPPGGGRGGARSARRGRGDRLVATAPMDRPATGRVPARVAERVARTGAGRDRRRRPGVRAGPTHRTAVGTARRRRLPEPHRPDRRAHLGGRRRGARTLHRLPTGDRPGPRAGGHRAAGSDRRAPRHRRPGDVGRASADHHGRRVATTRHHDGVGRRLHPPRGRDRTAVSHRRRQPVADRGPALRRGRHVVAGPAARAHPCDHRWARAGGRGRHPRVPLGRGSLPTGRGPGPGTAHGRAALRRPGTGDPGALPERAGRLPVPPGPHRVPATHPRP